LRGRDRGEFLARIFWDSNLFIYLFEGHPVFGPQVKHLRRRMLHRGDRLYTSTLSVGEILVKPVAVRRSDLAEGYLTFFRRPGINVLPFDFKAATFYGRIRQDKAIRAPDAIQLACAAAADIDLFITNDVRLSDSVVPGINFITSLERASV
jgi:predicted nucleic acid-binding protein